MATILPALSERVNNRALRRYERTEALKKHQETVQEAIATGEQEAVKNAERLRERGFLENIKLKAQCAPSGVRGRGQARQGASDLPPTSPGGSSYLYEGLEKPLGTPCEKLRPFLEVKDSETGVITAFQRNYSGEIFEENFDENNYLIEKYALQSQSRELLKDIYKQDKFGKLILDKNGHPIPLYRVVSCLRNVRSKQSGVDVISSSEGDKVRFNGLQTCGSVWHCPVCSSRISEFRAREMRFMCDMWQASGGGVLFITNTIRHGVDDDLRLLLEVLFGNVWHNYHTYRAVKKLKKELGYLGRVRSVEVTHGSNGWHPHIHEIWLIKSPLSFEQIKDVEGKLFKAWKTALKNVGMPSVTRSRGLTVQNGDNAAAYVAKFGRMPRWDMSTEITKSHSKTGRSGSRSPFDLLRDSLNGDTYAGKLFREYAIAFAGKRQLYYSPGLKEFFSLNERRDEEIAASNEDQVAVLANLTREEWKAVLVYGDRAVLLALAKNGGNEAILFYLRQIIPNSSYVENHRFLE